MLLNYGIGEDSWESLGLQGNPTIHPKGDQSWVFIGRTDFEAETPILRPPDAKSWLIWKDPNAGKDWEQEEKWMTEDEMTGWHHWLDGHGFVWTPGVGDGQGGLACCSPWGRKESDMTKRLNSTEGVDIYVIRSLKSAELTSSCPIYKSNIVLILIEILVWTICHFSKFRLSSTESFIFETS